MLELKAGLEIPSQEMPKITQETLERYADASGDNNPIHHDPQAAIAVGLPGVIAHGMLSAAYLAERATRYIRAEARAGDHWKLRQINTRFKSMAFLGDVLTIRGTVKEITEEKLVLDL